MGVKQVAAGQRNPQNRLDDVTDGAVVRQADLLRCIHEVTATGQRNRHQVRVDVTHLLVAKKCIIQYF